MYNYSVAKDYNDIESWCLGSHPWNLTSQRLLWENSSEWKDRTILVPANTSALTRCQSPDLAYRLIVYNQDDFEDFKRICEKYKPDLVLVEAPQTILGSSEEIWDYVFSNPDMFTLEKYDEIPSEWLYRPSTIFWQALFETEYAK